MGKRQKGLDFQKKQPFPESRRYHLTLYFGAEPAEGMTMSEPEYSEAGGDGGQGIDPDDLKGFASDPQLVRGYPAWILPHVEDARQNVLVRLLSGRAPGNWNSMIESQRRGYVRTCIRNEALHLAAVGAGTKSLPDGGGPPWSGPSPLVKVSERESPPPYEAIANAYRGLSAEERVVQALFLFGYQQKQIADCLRLSEATVSRLIDGIREKVKGNLKRSSSAMVSREAEIWGFVQKGDPDLGNDNLRRRIGTVLRPLSEAVPALIHEESQLPIPTPMLERIEVMIKQQHPPPTVEDVLVEVRKGKAPNEAELCKDILDAARMLAKPFRWVGAADAMRFLRDPRHVEEASGCLTKLLGASLQLLAAQEAPCDLTEVICGKLEDWCLKFGDQRGPRCAPVAPLTVSGSRVSQDASRMEQEAFGLFEKYRQCFEETRQKKLREGDAEVTFVHLQSLVDFFVRLHEWQLFDSPKYLAPAILEEAIEVDLASGGYHEKHKVCDELGDLLLMVLWLSNVLAVPELGAEVLDWLDAQKG